MEQIHAKILSTLAYFDRCDVTCDEYIKFLDHWYEFCITNGYNPYNLWITFISEMTHDYNVKFASRELDVVIGKFNGRDGGRYFTYDTQ